MLRKIVLTSSLIVLASCTTVPTSAPGPSYTPANAEALYVTPMPSKALASDAVLTRIAFGSCADEKKDQSIWNTIKADNPDLFLFIGDNVYGDPYTSDPRFSDPTMPMMRESYQKLAQSPEFAAFRDDVPLMVTWDDHDYGANDAGADYLFKETSEQLYLDAWDVPADDERRSRDGVYTSRIIGPEGRRVQIIMLDTRFFRTYLQRTDEYGVAGKERYVPLEQPNGTMLGEAQWNWLQDELEKPADLRLLVSSIQVHSDGHGWEAWKMMPHEREKLYDMIDATDANDVIILTGDRHAGSVYRRDDVIDYPLYEVTSSSLNVPASVWREESGETDVEPGPHRLHTMMFDANYGRLDIDWDSRTVDMHVISPGGETFSNQTTF